ncbi:glutamate receptor ionotropic, kainate 2 [Penaeus vannamei]|uniref:glutamate receptor ionotropic, kainate 2 n=1 Tax=Penaeus vannamei TaxID=6689 RepID=UPI00387F522E
MEFLKYLSLSIALLSLAGPSHGFLETSIGKMFFKRFTDVLEFPSVNIFISNKAGDSQLPMDVLKSLWSMKGYSVGVQKVSSSKDVIRVLKATSVDSLNVILLDDEADFNLLMMITREPLARKYSWLALGDVDPIVEGDFRLNLPIDNLMTFASLHTMNVTNTIMEKVVVMEVYSLAKDLPYISRVLAEWYGRGPLKLPLDGWSERRTNLTGLHLRCVTMPQEPFIYVSEPNDQLKVDLLGGYARDVFRALQEKLGFTYTCRLPPDYKWGSLENGQWNGLMKEMVSGRADVVVTSLDHNSARAKDVDFAMGLRKVGYRMVTRRPGLMDETWTSFTSELLPTAWAGTMAFVILAPPCLVFCSRLSPTETEKVSFKDAYILAIGAFAIQGSWLDVRSLSTRIVFITIFLATLVVYAHYTSALVSLLTVASTSVGFSSLQSLLEDGSYQFGFMSGTSLEDEFRNARQPIIREVWQQLIAPYPENLAVSDRAGVKKVIQGRYVYMMEENIYRSMFPNQCDTQLLRGQYFTTETGFAVPKGSPLKEIFDNQLMRMRDGGVLSRSWKRWQPPPPLCTAPPVVALNLHHLFTAFLLLLLGVVAALVFLPCEKLHWNFVGKEKAQKSGLSKPALAALPPAETRLRPGPLGGVWHSGGSASARAPAMPEDPDPTSTAYPAFQGATYGFT